MQSKVGEVWRAGGGEVMEACCCSRGSACDTSVVGVLMRDMGAMGTM